MGTRCSRSSSRARSANATDRSSGQCPSRRRCKSSYARASSNSRATSGVCSRSSGPASSRHRRCSPRSTRLQPLPRCRSGCWSAHHRHRRDRRLHASIACLGGLRRSPAVASAARCTPRSRRPWATSRRSARHLALAQSEPDAAVAALLDDAARTRRRARGARGGGRARAGGGSIDTCRRRGHRSSARFPLLTTSPLRAVDR